MMPTRRSFLRNAVLGAAGLSLASSMFFADKAKDQTFLAELKGRSADADAYGSKAQIDVIVENHVGISCNGAWLAGVMQQLNSPHGGTLADFGAKDDRNEPGRHQGVGGKIRAADI
jgi:hypothetical protein